MVFKRIDDPQQFFEQVDLFLMAGEAENNLMIGITHRLTAPGTATWFTEENPPLLCCVLDDSQVIGAAVMTPPYNLVLTRAPEPAIALLAQGIHQTKVGLPGLLAPNEAAEPFVAHWQRLSSQSAELTKSMRAHKLAAVIPVTGVPGKARKAAEDDLQLALEWFAAFAADTSTLCERPERIMEHIKAKALWLWTDPEPVAMALEGATTPNGRRVGGVYTPPEHRCHGYASALVAELSQSILNSGKQYSFLFTDLANRTANSIYAKIGYVPVCDYAEYRFHSSERDAL